MRSRFRLAPVALAALVLAACGGSSDTIRFASPDAGFTFSYPRELIAGFDAPTREIEGREPVFGTNVGVDEDNLIVVSQYTIKRPYESYEESEFAPFVDSAVRAIGRATKMKVTDKGRVDLDGMDAYDYRLEGDDGEAARMILGFRGRDQYFIRCSWNADGGEVIADACDDVRDSFAVVDDAG